LNYSFTSLVGDGGCVGFAVEGPDNVTQDSPGAEESVVNLGMPWVEVEASCLLWPGDAHSRPDIQHSRINAGDSGVLLAGPGDRIVVPSAGDAAATHVLLIASKTLSALRWREPLRADDRRI